MSGLQWTPAQRQAVETPGSLVIAAGAGSGKTRVLTARVIEALERGVRPQAMVVVTFTTAAAGELLTRIRAAVQAQATSQDGQWARILNELPLMTVTTIDSLCARITREHPGLSGAGLGFEILEPADAQLWERRWRSRVLAELPPPLLSHVPGRLRDKALRVLLDAASGEASETGVIGGDPSVRTTLLEMARHVQTRLEALRIDEAVATYPDLEVWASRALQHEEVRAYYARRWTHIMVDELQDTSERQWEILRALCGDTVVMTCVGDVQQSVYGFRGAEPRVVQAARELVLARGGLALEMHASFRSAPALVETVNAACLRLMPGPDGTRPDATRFTPLVAARTGRLDDPSPVDLQLVHGGDSGGRALTLGRVLAGRMQALLGHPVYDRGTGHERPARWRDMALLVRTRTHLAAHERALREAGIPYEVHGGRGLYDRPEIIDAIMLLRAVADPADDLALAAVLRGPYALLSDDQLQTLSGDRGEESLWAALRRSPDPAGQQVAARVQAWRALSGLQPASRVLERAHHDTGAAAIHAAGPDGARRAANLRRFSALLRGWAQDGRPDVRSVARYLADLQSVSAQEAEATTDAPDAVQVMTVHGAKGLEWPVVLYTRDFAPRPDHDTVRLDPDGGLILKEDTAAWAAARERAAQRDLLEEERVTYVALTRAADRLVIGLAASDGRVQTQALQGVADAFLRHVPRRMFAAGSVPEGRPLPLVETADGLVLTVTPGPEVALPGRLPVTGLALYARCPQAFAFQHLHGYLPLARAWGSGEPMTREARRGGRDIGDAVHQALEKGWDEGMTRRRLRALSPSAGEEVAWLVGRLQAPAFDGLRGYVWQREHPVEVTIGSRTVYGIADAVDVDGALVIDYKTDQEVQPGHHRMQLALYAHALGVTRAALVYLRQDLIHWFDSEDLEQGLEDARDVIRRMEALDMAPTPSRGVCGSCPFRGVCRDGRVMMVTRAPGASGRQEPEEGWPGRALLPEST